MALHLGAPSKRHCERTKTSQFSADDGTMASHAISMGAFRHAPARGCPTEA